MSTELPRLMAQGNFEGAESKTTVTARVASGAVLNIDSVMAGPIPGFDLVLIDHPRDVRGRIDV